MNVSRTKDWELVKRIVTHPKVYGAVSDDFSPAPEKWEPLTSDAVHYLLVSHEEKPLGLFALMPQNRVCWQVHTCLLPDSYGELAKRAGAAGIEWVWSNTECLRLTTEVPAYNRLALKFSKDCGMTEYGLNPKAYMKHGKLRDLILLGISRCQ